MNAFVNAPSMTVTTNGMEAYDKTGSKLVDLFFNIGSSRNNPNIVQNFMTAYGHDKLLAMKCLFWARDVRGGAGEREVFKKILIALCKSDPDTLIKNIHLIPVYGRWDDGFAFSSERTLHMYFTLIKNTLDRCSYASKVIEKLDSMTEEECQDVLHGLTCLE